MGNIKIIKKDDYSVVGYINGAYFYIQLYKNKVLSGVIGKEGGVLRGFYVSNSFNITFFKRGGIKKEHLEGVYFLVRYFNS
jgi:hypothetical protein